MVRRRWLRLVAFLGLLFAQDRGLYHLLDAGYRRTTRGETGGLVNMARRVRAPAVVLGSSRAWRHYDPEVLSRALGMPVYNAGCDGQAVPYACGVADLLLHDYTPDLFIVNIDPDQFIESPDTFERVTILAPYIGESPVIRRMIYKRGLFEPIKYLSMSFRYNGKPLAIARHLLAAEPGPTNGFNPWNQTMTDEPVPPPGEAREGDDHAKVDPLLIELLRETIQTARARGVRLAMVTSPRLGIPMGTNARDAGAETALAQLARDEGVPWIVIDETAAAEFRDPSLFADRAHLNGKGAALFSRLLGERLGASGFSTVTAAGSGPASRPVDLPPETRRSP